MTNAAVVTGTVVAGPAAGRTKAGRKRVAVFIEDGASRACWLLHGYTDDARSTLAAVAPGDRLEAHGRADHARRTIDAGRIHAPGKRPGLANEGG